MVVPDYGSKAASSQSSTYTEIFYQKKNHVAAQQTPQTALAVSDELKIGSFPFLKIPLLR